jgi:hypothetical protein
MTARNRTPCSANQQMVADLLARDYVFNVPCLLRAIGVLRIDVLRDALQLVVERHEILRCGFVRLAGTLFQDPTVSVEVAVPLIDVSDAEAPLEAALAEIAADCRVSFALARVPRLRATVFRLAANDHVVSIIIDHLAADGVSLGIVMGELRCLYQAIEAGTPHGFPAPAPQYRDFALWQRAWLQGAQAAAQRAYWRDHLADLPLPIDERPPPALHETVAFTLAAETTAALASLCVRHKVTPFMALLTVYAPLLAATTGGWDLVIGTVRANRRRPQANGVVGHFANLIPLRLRIDPDWSWRRLFGCVGEICRAGASCEALPFAEIAATAWAQHGIRGARLTDFTVNFIPFPGEPVPWGDRLRMAQLWGLLVQELPATSRASLFVRQQPGGLGGTLLFDPGAIDRTWAHALPGRLSRVIEQAARAPDRRVGATISSDLSEQEGRHG